VTLLDEAGAKAIEQMACSANFGKSDETEMPVPARAIGIGIGLAALP
jgi:hypothetical protein